MESLIFFWNKYKLKIMLYSSLAITLIIASLSFFLITKKYETSEINDELNILSEVAEKMENKDETEENIKVDIKGQVQFPGVYELKPGTRVIDAIETAGGLLEDSYTKYINLSKILADEDIIIISHINELNNSNNNIVCETINSACITTNKTITNNSENKNSYSLSTFVNINTASKEELTTLNGVGESIALKIIDYRTTNGKFKSIEDIKNVSGIGEAVYAKIKDNIEV